MSKSLTRVAHRNPEVIESGERFTTNPDGSVTLHIPISFKRHGGRKYIIAPTEPHIDAVPPKESILRALGRAFHWQALLGNDAMLTQDDIAEGAGFGRSYVSKVMQLTLLAPDVLEALLDGNYPKYLTLADINKAGYVWADQRNLLGLK